MSVIFTVTDPATDKETLKAKGVIKRVIIKRINADGSPKVTQIKSGPKKGSTINSTHRAFLIVESEGDEAMISFGEHEVKNAKYENQYQVKEDGSWVELLPGMEISIYPLTSRSYEKDGETKTAYSAKKSGITILSKANAHKEQPKNNAPTNPQGGSQSKGGTTTKVYGEILSMDGSRAKVKGEKGEWEVTLSDEQKGQVEVGGRLAGQMAQDGTLTQFKAYGPVGAKPAGNTQSKGGFKRDDLPIRLGNAFSITKEMFPDVPIDKQEVVVKQALDAMDALRATLKEEHKEMDDYALGARLGQSGLMAASERPENIETFVQRVHAIFNFFCYMEGVVRGGTPSAEKEPEHQISPETPPKGAEVKENGHVDMQPQGGVLDFDEDIPF